MAETSKNEEREIDLTIGFNKQLVSIVFIIFVLFGVVFSMGYFVGRASSGTAESGQQSAVKPAESTGQGRPDAVGPQAATPQPSGAPAQTAPEQPLSPGEGRVTEPAPAAAAPAEEQQAPAPAAAPVKEPEPPKPAGQTFLQVAAVKREQAQMLQDVLKDKGFQTTLVPVTVDGQQLFRTLVGPLNGPTDVAKTKAGLEAAGFKPIIKKF